MNNQEAKFILGAYRPDGRDASNPQFVEALAQAETDAELRSWFARQRLFDASVAAKLREITPPAGLRDAIVAGVRASRPRSRWWSQPGWISAAAAIVLLSAILAVAFRLRTPAVADLAEYAIGDLADAHDAHVGYPAGFEVVQAQLSTLPVPFTRAQALALDLSELQRKNCRSVRIGGREMFEICFQRDGVWFHLYAGRRTDFRSTSGDRPLIASRAEFAGASWADAQNVYALVTAAGPEALRRLL